MATVKKPRFLDESPKVDAFMANLDHPLKAEVEAVRQIILKTDPRITEGIKWNAPSFYYKGDMTVFMLRATHRVHLVWPSGMSIDDPTGLLEDDYPDGRRMSYFTDMNDVNAKKASLETVVRQWIKLMDSQNA